MPFLCTHWGYFNKYKVKICASYFAITEYAFFILTAYLAVVKKEVVDFEQEARQYARLGEVQKAEVFMTKKKYAEKEVS